MNPLAFSTLGCPDWTLDEILQAAQRFGYQAIELRGLGDQIDVPRATPFLPENRAESRRKITDAGLSVCCVASSGVIAQANVEHVKDHVALAADLGCPWVRVFGGTLPVEIPHEAALSQAAETLYAFGEIAAEHGVALVLETHDSFSTGAQVAELLHLTQHPAVFALWDLHHPYRQGESPATTYGFLQDYIKYVHVKDSRDGQYTLMGAGDIPLTAMLDLILDGGYTGAISVEWEKRWIPELAAPEIVFAQYGQSLREYLSRRSQ